MLNINDAKQILHGPKLPRRDQLLVLLAVEPMGALPVQRIKERCEVLGLRKLSRLDVSGILSSSSGFVARTSDGWELQLAGIARVREVAEAARVNPIVTHASQSLRSQVDSVGDALTKSFVVEAIGCFEARRYRAAVVFSWAGAVALLYSNVCRTQLAAFNAEAVRRDPKWRTARNQDDLGRMRERDFLDVCEAIGVLGRSVKQILQNECLVLRNACGHPNSAMIAENSAAAHIEKLIKNIYSQF